MTGERGVRLLPLSSVIESLDTDYGILSREGRNFVDFRKIWGRLLLLVTFFVLLSGNWAEREPEPSSSFF